MSDTQNAFIRDELSPARAAPVTSVGLLGFLRTRLFSSPLNIALTIVSAVLLYILIVPTFKFLVIDAVWQGKDRDACLETTVGPHVGACWPFVQAKIGQFIYGFYPLGQRWRVDLVFFLSAVLLLPLLIPRLPGKTLNAGLFFFALPVVAFFLLYGGGLQAFVTTWVITGIVNLLTSFEDLGVRLAAFGTSVGGIGQILYLLGSGVALLFTGLLWLVTPLMLLRDLIRGSGSPVWVDFAVTLAITLGFIAWLGGLRNGVRALVVTIIAFAGIAAVIVGLDLTNGGLPLVDTRLWGGLLVTLVVSVTGIVASMPIGIALALGRRSEFPLIQYFSIAFIEFWRGVPLITVLFFATYMLPLFMPTGFTIDGMVRVLVGIALFAGAYNAEVIRGGLQAIPRGQAEAASALGLSYPKTTAFVVMPQALRHVIPGLVNSFIALFKDTTLVLIVGILDLLGQIRAAFSDPNWAAPTTLFTGFAFAGIIYFVTCFSMSRYSLFVERRLNAHRRT
jgi:general L-amino acid transport system permease protein